jgi:energy-coupling factor transporter ATP-binding protein EcfA2
MVDAVGGPEKFVAKTALEFVKLAHKEGWLDRLIASLKKKHNILVLGSTGVGKTNLLRSLSQYMPDAIDALSRTEYVTKERLAIGNQPFVFIDTPGQIEHRSRRIRAVREAMAAGIDGVINVGCFGYHEYRIGKQEALSNTDVIKEDFLERHRQVEIAALDEWTPILGGLGTAKWLITVVSKADLWWDRRDEVIRHYVNGPYHVALGEATTLDPAVLEYCSVFHKFYGDGAMAGTFDEGDRIRARVHLLTQLLRAIVR